MPHRESRAAEGADAFVGREPESDRLAALLLARTPLITVVGAGGIGKTRLVTEAVRRYRRARGVPVLWGRLARLPAGAGPEAIVDELVRSVADTGFATGSSWHTLVETLDQRDSEGRAAQTVVVVDSCEHLRDSVASVIVRLLDAVPELTVVATSRQPLERPEERILPVPPLTHGQGVTLFRRRATLTGTVIEDDQLAVVESICTHLGNQPLPIRLAAARLRRQSLGAMLEDLSGTATDRRLRWPRGPRGGVEERHYGIADAIAWSFDLCSDPERLLLERMSVFAPGYDSNPDDEPGEDLVRNAGVETAAIQAVCGGTDDAGDRLEPAETGPLLEQLGERSLVIVNESGTAPRYSMSENIRVFAHRRLCERAESEPSRLCAEHGRHYRDRIAESAAAWFGTRDRRLLGWALDEWDNLLLALETSLSTPDRAVVGLEIATGLFAHEVPFINGRLRDARRWAERTLAATRGARPEPVALQVSAMVLIARINLCQGRPEDTRRLIERCVELCGVGIDDRDAWRRHPDRDVGLPARLEFAIGAVLMFDHEDLGALHVLERARDKFSASNNHGGVAMTEGCAALASALLSPPGQALENTARFLDTAGRSGDEWVEAWAQMAWTIARTRHGEPRAAVATGRTALARLVLTRDTWGAIWAAHACAWALAAAGSRSAARPESMRYAADVARLLGGLRALRTQLGIDITTLRPFASETSRATEIVRTALGQHAFDAARRDGTSMRPALADLARWALDVPSPGPSGSARPDRPIRTSPWQRLSAAEADVAVLAAAGWTNAAIAARRGSSRRTVEAQITRVLKKLSIRSRAEIHPMVPVDHRGDGPRRDFRPWCVPEGRR
ncbi:putative ATPase/DNA-binding CsgD family transcriptional regulator [Nocardia transvalensis]|uniref:Putative ATPase/DNA-binding CsgD family transcriptional regulator n=1 Tax=Nocardia transvalensis TaxID=37333 RepID=A0A7W9P9K5_9NOCA|nr:AAA family ATPase [Nocardia transvalensis]MBB5912024.1 putative ATPase/DNA-binding CsgD family transcriptional regulator [Nocardia transvalensis]